jgi:hypothetical protein
VVGEAGGAGASRGRGRAMMAMGGFVLTRLHARYSKDGISEDLVFKEAPAIAGGREWRGPSGTLEEGKVASPINNFQARYAIRHEWTGPIGCDSPTRGVWGGPPAGQGQAQPKAATDLAFVPRGQTQLASIVRQDVPEADPALVEQSLNDPGQKAAEDTGKRPAAKESKGCATGGGARGWAAVFVALFLFGLRRRDRRGR